MLKAESGGRIQWWEEQEAWLGCWDTSWCLRSFREGEVRTQSHKCRRNRVRSGSTILAKCLPSLGMERTSTPFQKALFPLPLRSQGWDSQEQFHVYSSAGSSLAYNLHPLLQMYPLQMFTPLAIFKPRDLHQPGVGQVTDTYVN